MEPTSSNNIEANRSLAHEVIAYAETCTCEDLPRETPAQSHACWQSRYFRIHSRMSPAIAATLSGEGTIRPDTVFLSLCDREELVALRLLLALSGVGIEEIRSGMQDDRFPPFTAAVSAFVRSSLRVVHLNPDAWQTSARGVLDTWQPRLLIVEGLRFGQNADGRSAFAESAELIQHAKANHCGVLLFD